MKVMLLAAGKGERMQPLTSHTPKPLLQAGGYSLLEHLIRKLAADNFTDLVINHAWLGQQVEAAFGDGSKLGVQIAWSRETEPLETAGGIIKALPLLGDAPFAVVNGDIFTDYPFGKLRTALAAQDHVHLVLVTNPAHHPKGDFSIDSSGRLHLPTTSASQPVDTFTYSGIGVFHPQLFAGVTETKYPLLPLLRQAINSQQASGSVYNGKWMDIGTPQRLAQLDQQLRAC
jgi:N-acetyl-alpha-D-muramate 1-phosphate uridylyltransferase